MSSEHYIDFFCHEEDNDVDLNPNEQPMSLYCTKMNLVIDRTLRLVGFRERE